MTLSHLRQRKRSGLKINCPGSFSTNHGRRFQSRRLANWALLPSFPRGPLSRVSSNSKCVFCARKQLFSLLSPGLVAKNVARNNCGATLSMKTQIPNINAVRSAWRRVKKDIKEAIIRDLQPVKDVKGGGGAKGESKPTTGRHWDQGR